MLKIQMFIHKLMNPLANKEGAAAVEYGIMVGLIAIAIIVTVTALGGTLNNLFDYVETKLAAVPLP
jgi:pilus assembly protein Flp/PilA